jgi:hypothetical protein
MGKSIVRKFKVAFLLPLTIILKKKKVPSYLEASERSKLEEQLKEGIHQKSHR